MTAALGIDRISEARRPGAPGDGMPDSAGKGPGVLKKESPLAGSAGEDRRPCRVRADLVVHELDGEALIYDPLTADTHHLNATACFMFRRLQASDDPAVLAADLAGRYELDGSDARAHVEGFLAELRQAGLIAESPAEWRVP